MLKMRGKLVRNVGRVLIRNGGLKNIRGLTPVR